MRERGRLRGALLAALVLALAGCGHHDTLSGPGVDYAGFEEAARHAPCADVRNRLFLIDHALVFWDRAGSCYDAAYTETLYRGRIDRVLCTVYDSFAGRVESYPDSTYRPLFQTVLAHLDRPDLGLGPAHTVQPIPF